MKTIAQGIQTCKRLMGLLTLFAVAVLTYGDNITVSMAGFSIAPGETHTVSIDVTSDVECGSAFEGIIDLPAGLTIVPTEDDDYVTKDAERCSKKFSVSSATSLENKSLQPNQVKFSLYSSNGDNLANTSGAVLYFTVSASDELAENSQIRLIEGLIKGNNPSSSEPSIPVSCAADVHNSTFEAAVINLTAQPFSLTPSKEHDLTFAFEKNKEIVSFQTDITLPEGLSFVAYTDGEYVVFNEERLTKSHVAETNLLNDGKTLRIILYHPKNMPVKLDTGDFFTVKLKADGGLSASSDIKVSNMEFVQNSTNVFNPADFTVTVSNPDVAAKADADSQISELKKSFDDVLNIIKGYAESVQKELQTDIEAINVKIAAIDETLAIDAANGDVQANSETRAAAIAETKSLIVALKSKAAEAQAAYEAAEAQKANEAQHTADLNAIAEAEKKLAEVKTVISTYDESVQKDVEDDIKAADDAIATLKAAADESYNAGTSVADAEKLANAIADTKAQIEALAQKAAEAQEAWENDEARKANEAQHTADLNAIAEAEQKLADVKTAISAYDESVQKGVEDDINAADDAITSLKTAAEESYKAGTAVADAEKLANAISDTKAQIEALAQKAAEMQKAYEEAEAQKANELQHAADLAAIAEARAQLDALYATVSKMDRKIRARYAAALAGLTNDIDNLSRQADASYEARTAVADADKLAGNIAAVRADIEKLAAEIDEANKAFEANEAQYRLDLELINSTQQKLDAVKEKIKGYDQKVQDIVADDARSIQDRIYYVYNDIEYSHSEDCSIENAGKLRDEIKDIEALIAELDRKAAAEQEKITSGINGITSDDGSQAEMYDIYGRRMQNAKGIVIVNGKKYAIK